MVLKIQLPQAGTVDRTTDGSGDGSTSVTLPNPIPGDYSIVATIREADSTGTLYISSITKSGFTVNVDGSAVVSGTLTISWIAMKSS